VTFLKGPYSRKLAFFQSSVYLEDVSFRRDVDGEQRAMPLFIGASTLRQRLPEALELAAKRLIHQEPIRGVATPTNHGREDQAPGFLHGPDHVVVADVKGVERNVAQAVLTWPNRLRPHELCRRSMPCAGIQTESNLDEPSGTIVSHQ
jgi:hypothetical protein